MTCSLCANAYALSSPVVDKAGNKRAMCIQCAAEQGKPSAFPEGTQPSSGVRRTDFVDDERSQLGRDLEMAAAQRDALAGALSRLLRAFPELGTGLSSAPQQRVLREARALLAEVGL